MSQEVTEVTKTYRKPVESDFDLSGKLIEVEWAGAAQGYQPTVPPDTAKGNTSPLQHAFLGVASNAGDYAAYVGTQLQVDLRESQNFIIYRINSKLNFSRTKGGWSGMLAKTSKSISEQSLVEKAQEIQASQEKKKGLSRFLGK